MKKLIIISLFITLCSSIYIYINELITPINANGSQNSFNIDLQISDTKKIESIDQAIEYALSNNKSILLFYQPKDNNSIYLQETILSSIEKKYELDISDIGYIDISILGDDFSNTIKKRKWNLNSNQIPTLSYVSKDKNNNIIYHDQISWSTNTPLTIDLVEDWLIKIKYIEIDDPKNPIDTPID